MSLLTKHYYKKELVVDNCMMIKLSKSEIEMMLNDLKLSTTYACLQELNIDLNVVSKQQEIESLKKELEELKEYKQLEEQGLLLRLHCKVGDTIYKIPSEAQYGLNILHHHEELNMVRKQDVCKISITDNGKFGLLIGYATCGGLEGVVSSMFGENWFLTEEEAEAKLEELRGEK